MTRRILFVCMGDICRSPAGEGVMLRQVDQRDLTDQIVVDSAGTIGFHAGKPADPRMRSAAARRGLNLTSHARQVTGDDIDAFDLLIAMDRENQQDLFRLAGGQREHIRLLSDFLADDWPTDVPDPYYGGTEGFEYVLDMIESACPTILDHLICRIS